MVTFKELLDRKYPADKRAEEKVLELENNGGPEGTIDLKDFSNLETLKLYGNGINDDTYFSIIQSIPNKEKIKSLGFGNNPIKNPKFDYIGANFTNLEDFSLYWDPVEENTSVKGLEKCKKLTVLWIGEGEKRIKDMEYLPASLNQYNGYTDTPFFKDLKKLAQQRESIEQLAKGRDQLQKDQALVDEVKKYWGSNLAEFGDILDVEGLAKIKEKLNQSQTDETSLKSKLENQQNTVSKLNENINALGEENQDLKKELEDLQKQLQQAKASSNLVQEGEELDWIKLSTLKDVSIHHADLRIYLKADKTKIEQKEVYWDEVFDETEEKMKKQACSWLTDVVNSVNKEVNDYGGKVKREKRGTYHPRAHYFIFYKDDSQAHWLALLPQVSNEQAAIELVEGHEHKTFTLEFDKSVKKFVDVYTCLGCGASNQFDDLHSNYGYTHGYGVGSEKGQVTMPTDDWEKVHKEIPFKPWYNELTNIQEKGGNIESPSGKILGRADHVWQGATIQDPKGKTFDRAYGYINKEGNLEWRLERTLQGIEENEEWALNEISERINSLWENKDFTNWKDKSPCQQRMMYSFVQGCLKEEDHKLVLKYSGGEKTLEINDLLAKIGNNFRELISAKKTSYQFLEKWIKQILDGSNIREVGNDEEFVALKNKPLAIREVWGQQVERFIQENKGKKFYSEHHQEGLTWEDHARIKIDWLYEEVRDKLELENQVFEAQVEVAAKK